MDIKLIEKEFERYTLEVNKKKPLTAQTYCRNVRDFHTRLEIKTLEELQNISRENMKEYIEYQTKNYAPTTVNNRIATLKVYYKFLIYYGYVKENLIEGKDKIKVKPAPPQFLEIDEMLKLLETADNLKKGNDKNSIRNALVIDLCLNIGLRIFEVRNLKLSNFNMKNYSVTLIGKNDIERTLFLAERTIKDLKEWLEVRDKIEIKEGHEDYLFISSLGKQISKRRLQQIVEDYVKIAGVSKVSSHKLRHTFATVMVGNKHCSDEELQSMLGHKHIRTTMGYRHALKEGLMKSKNMVGFN